MGRYISPIMVSSVLRTALAARGWVAGVPTGSVLSAVVTDSMIGLRLFVDPDRLPDLMLELADILEDAAP